MIEAEITCECPAIQLVDLQLSLTRGMVVYLEATVARGSQDLQRAIRARGVTVKYVQRFRERRPAMPVMPSPAPPPKIPPLPSRDREVEAIACRVVELLAPQFQEVLQALRAIPSIQISSGGVRGGPVLTGGKVLDDVPVFVPSQIGRDDLRPQVSVPVTEGSGGEVTDAATALKAARKAKRST